MATSKFYLDTRSSRPGNAAPLKLAISAKGQTSLISLNVKLLPYQWDKKTSKVINHPNKATLNNYLAGRKIAVDNLLYHYIEVGILDKMKSTELKNKILRDIRPAEEAPTDERSLFAGRFLKFASVKKASTKDIYMSTYKRMTAYIGEGRLKELTFEDVTKEWLVGFDTFLQKTNPSKNARNIHLRNIRAVFNEALDDEITTFYPFRRFKIRQVATAKRSLTAEQLRTLFNCPTEPHVTKYLDMFKLMFFLIGINSIDLCNLKKARDGRVEYHRSKTSRLYSIKVEPEAMEIIKKYPGEGQLLDIMDRYGNHKDYVKRMNWNLKHIGQVEVGKQGKKTYKPLFPFITSYWARHSWATIAAELEIPKETIAAALGHGGNTVTDIYIDFDRKKVDEANRRVIDFVLYGKK